MEHLRNTSLYKTDLTTYVWGYGLKWEMKFKSKMLKILLADNIPDFKK